MDLIINTSDKNFIYVALKEENRILAEKKIKAERRQSELLLVSIDKLLKTNSFKLSDISSILVAQEGDSFSALRIGIITANALGFALNKPTKILNSKKENNNYNNQFSIVEPKYNKEPNITKKKEKL